MELFEILFVALFILIPIVEGILKKGRTRESGGSGQEGRSPERLPGRTDGRADEHAERRPGGEGATTAAADMVPDDLWELLTGERRSSGRVAVETPQDAHPEAADTEPWSAEPTWSPTSREPELERSEWGTRATPEDRPLFRSPSSLEDRLPPSEPVSLEYLGPEAYSLEQPPPPPEVRHARFHEKIDRRPPARPARVPTVIRTLGRSAGLRDAVVLSEILSRPKGLE